MGWPNGFPTTQVRVGVQWSWVQSDIWLSDTLGAVRRRSVGLGLFAQKELGRGSGVCTVVRIIGAAPKVAEPLVHHEPLMIGTMNPLSWSFAVLIDLPGQKRCPSERNRGDIMSPSWWQ